MLRQSLEDYVKFLREQKPNDGNALVARSRIVQELEELLKEEKDEQVSNA